jgi:hypothetical protein
MRTLSKNQLLGFTITSGIVFLVFLFANVACLMWVGLIGTVVFGVWWYTRFQRDQQILQGIRSERQRAAAPTAPHLPPQTTPGSSYIGPLPPLDEK